MPDPGNRSLLAGVLSRIRWRALDRALASGADPASSATLARRARRLTDRGSRERLAASLRGVIAAAGQPPAMPSSRIPPSRPEAPAARGRLRTIEWLLESAAPLYAEGLARLELLLTNGAGPLYSPDYPAALNDELDRIMAAMGAREEDSRHARVRTR